MADDVAVDSPGSRRQRKASATPSPSKRGAVAAVTGERAATSSPSAVLAEAIEQSLLMTETGRDRASPAPDTLSSRAAAAQQSSPSSSSPGGSKRGGGKRAQQGASASGANQESSVAAPSVNSSTDNAHRSSHRQGRGNDQASKGAAAHQRAPEHTKPGRANHNNRNQAAVAASASSSSSPHPAAASSQSHSPVCQFFLTPAGCMSGAACAFSHQMPATVSVAASSPASSSSTAAHNGRNSTTAAASASAQAPTGSAAGTRPSREQRASTLPVCRFFRQGECASGANCRFRHPTPEQAAGEQEAKAATAAASEEPASSQKSRRQNLSKRSAATSATAAVPSSSSSMTASKAPATPENPQTAAPAPPPTITVAALFDVQLQQLRAAELTALKRRFTSAQLQPDEVSSTTPVATITFDVVPTDPDWPFEVDAIRLQVALGPRYPLLPPAITALPTQTMPERFVGFLNRLLVAPIAEQHQLVLSSKFVQPASGAAPDVQSQTPLLMIRPFLKWLDKNLERLFVEAGRQMRRDDEIRKTLKFVSATELRTKVYGSEEAAAEPTPPRTINNGPSNSNAGAASVASNAISSGSNAAKVTATSKPPEQERFNSNDVFAGVDSDDDDSDDSDDDDSDDSDDDSNLDDVSDDAADSGEDNAESGEDQTDEFASAMPQLSAMAAAAAPKGTEVRLTSLQMTNIALLRVELLHLSLQCSRCKASLDIKLRPLSSPAGECERCRSAFSVHLRPAIVHAASPALGYLEMAGCSAVDVVSHDSEVTFQCLACMNESTIRQSPFVLGETRTHPCRHCHESMSVALTSITFVRHLEGSDAAGTSNDATGGKSASGVTNMGKRLLTSKRPRPVKDPNIKPGSPLPDFGTCAHYKKSYRWVRFPCCGRAFACDICHNENTPDGHHPQWATRMICGFCSKEQNFAAHKPCSCGKALTADTSTRYWEGGEGCRNKKSMSRKDKHKFSDSKLKTHSRKADRVGPKKAGKNDEKGGDSDSD